MLSQRGKIFVVYESFKFRNVGKVERGIKWRCTNKYCSSKLYTDEREKEINHNHASSETLQRQTISNSIKRKAVDICERPAQIIHRELSKSFPSDLETINCDDLRNIRKCMYYNRRSALPPLPKTIVETQNIVENLIIKTSKNERFVLANDFDSNIIILSCVNNIKFLCTCETIFVDGTFNYAPKFFLQMFSIHGMKNGHYVPLVFCLLPNKNRVSNLIAFQIIEQRCSELGLRFSPNEVVADFEESIHSAITSIWPNTKLIGCRFHLSQLWMRKIQQLGLVCDYKNPESNVGNFLHWIFGLIFLEPHNVGDCFAFDFAPMQIENDKLTSFLNYLVENYIEEDSRFPPKIWACASATLQRTTNCEKVDVIKNEQKYMGGTSRYSKNTKRERGKIKDEYNCLKCGRQHSRGKFWEELVFINNKPVNFKLDSGAICNVLPYDVVKNLERENSIKSSNKTIIAYGENKIKVIGEIIFKCIVRKNEYKIKFLVVDVKSRPILGLNACVKLNLISKIDEIDVDIILRNEFINKNLSIFERERQVPFKHKTQLKENYKAVKSNCRRLPNVVKEKQFVTKNYYDKTALDKSDFAKNENVLLKVRKEDKWISRKIIDIHQTPISYC
ncbi:hypothetical protein ILUMI_27152 [Ignelater luminosus]|uniref:MULE transposase domain-containing protein n=1 Tax=Ignelater luminosus TaxID=2038154 RepID=A0A8K0C741_IGNLU|nr:hypothetical protein ILUMI_27152 [Ignelater luminosus]